MNDDNKIKLSVRLTAAAKPTAPSEIAPQEIAAPPTANSGSIGDTPSTFELVRSATPVAAPRPTLPEHFDDSLSVKTYDPFVAARRSIDGPYYGTEGFETVYLQTLAAAKRADPALVEALRGQPRTRFRTLDRANIAASANGKQALAVWERLANLKSPHLTSEHMRLLVSGVAFPRLSGDFLQRGLLGATSALDAAAVIVLLDDNRRAALGDLLGRAAGDVERILILKSLASRSPRLLANGRGEAAEAWDEVCRFAALIRRTPEGILRERASLINNNNFNYTSVAVLQQAGNSCVATSALYCMAEADPYLAWAAYGDGRTRSYDRHGVFARLQEAMLESDFRDFGKTWDVFLPKNLWGITGAQEKLIKQACREGILDKKDKAALLAITGSDILEEIGLARGIIENADGWKALEAKLATLATEYPAATQAFQKLRAALDGNQRGREVAYELLNSLETLLRDNQRARQGPKGIDPDLTGDTFIQPFTHLRYNRVKYCYRIEADPFHPERLAQVLEAGQPVLLRSGNPEDLETDYSHCLSAFEVAGEPGKRQFAVIDPMGFTSWMSQGAFRRLSYYFGHSYPQVGVGRAPKGRPGI